MAGNRPWTKEEDALLLTHAATGDIFDDIGGRLQRSKEATRLRYLGLLQRMKREDRVAAKLARDKNFRVPSRFDFIAPEDVVTERDTRLQIGHRSLTAAILGDPLPGRSALDRKLNSNKTGESHASHY